MAELYDAKDEMRDEGIDKLRAQAEIVADDKRREIQRRWQHAESELAKALRRIDVLEKQCPYKAALQTLAGLAVNFAAHIMSGDTGGGRVVSDARLHRRLRTHPRRRIRPCGGCW